MVKVGLNIKNGSKVFKPKPGDVIIFDGKDWYVTTKDDIFREYQMKMDAMLTQIGEELKSIREFKVDIANQMTKMGEAVRKFIIFEGDK